MLLGFKQRFEDPINIGTKVFTMRNDRKVQPKIGETLYMYTGLRTANCRKISDKEKLQSTQRVRILIIEGPRIRRLEIYVDGRMVQGEELVSFVKYDGFTDIQDFIQYWCASSTGKPFSKKKDYHIGGFLTLYHWTDLRF